jgi:small-conductance mechanosensitive channel
MSDTALGFIQTTIMEMGQPPAVQGADPPIWVKSRQYTGRVVTVANGEIFKTPVFNYTRDFPYIWEEITIPISYKDDRARAEQVLLEAAQKHALKASEVSAEDLKVMEQRYFIPVGDLAPKVYYRITDNWLELTLRFIFNVRGVREVKDLINRDILTAFDAAGIGIASATYDIVGFPPIRLERTSASRARRGEDGAI